MKECSLCLTTSRDLHAQRDIERVRLTPPLPADEEVSNFRTQCLECSADYAFSRSGEWDDGQYFTTETLKRLSFAAARPSSPLPDFRAALQAPSEWVRRNAAWNLCEMGEALPLLSFPDSVVREEALASAMAHKTLLTGDQLRTLMRDESARTRKLATTLLVPRRIARGEARALMAELLNDEDPARVFTTLWELDRSKDPAIGAASAALLPLLSRADEAVRRETARILQQAFRRGQLGDDIAVQVLSLAQRNDEAAAGAAMEALCGWGTSSIDAVLGATRWLPAGSANLPAVNLLMEQAGLGADLSPALQALSDLVGARRYFGEPSKVLLRFLRMTRDKMPVIRALIPGLRKQWPSQIIQEIEEVASQGVDLTSLLPQLRASVTDENAKGMRQLFKTMGVE